MEVLLWKEQAVLVTSVVKKVTCLEIVPYLNNRMEVKERQKVKAREVGEEAGKVEVEKVDDR
jgi:hypothetical protein